MSLSNLRDQCLNGIDSFCNRSDMSHDMKNRRVGQALDYIRAAHDQYSQGGSSYGQGGQCQQTKDNLGRCHAGENCQGYRPGMFMPCRDQGDQDMYGSGSYTGGSRVGQARGSRGYGSRGSSGQCQQTKDNLGRCHAGENCQGYRPGMFMPCRDQQQGSNY